MIILRYSVQIFFSFLIVLICMSIMESRSSSISIPQSKRNGKEMGHRPFHFNPNPLESTTDRSYSFNHPWENDGESGKLHSISPGQGNLKKL